MIYGVLAAGLSDRSAKVINALVVVVLTILLLAAVYAVGWLNGQQHEQDKALRQVAAEAAATAADTVHAASVAASTVTVYVDRVRTVYKTGATIIKEIPVYVPASTPDLPAGFRVLHDAAAEGSAPDRARLATAASVPVADATRVVADNYTEYHDLASRHDALATLVEEFLVRQGKE